MATFNEAALKAIENHKRNALGEAIDKATGFSTVLTPRGMIWRCRESQRSADTTKRTPIMWSAIDVPPMVNHFAFVSNTNPALVAFTENEAKGVADKQATMKPGRYLNKYYSLPAVEIEKLCAQWTNETKGGLQFANTADEIENVYTTCASNLSACMSHEASHYTSDEHPVCVYGNEGNVETTTSIAFIREDANDDDSEVIARVLVSSHTSPPTYGNTMYGDESRLRAALDQAGYVRDEGSCMNGARIRKVSQGNGYVLPYVDGYGVSHTDSLEHFVLARHADISCGMQNGVSVQKCAHCEGDIDDESPTYIDGLGEVCSDCASYCPKCDESCLSETMERVDISGDRYDNEQYWCEYCFENESVECAECPDRVATDEAKENNDGDQYCSDDCLEQSNTEVECCAEWVNNDQVKTISVDGDDRVMCASCVDDDLFECSECRDYFENGDAHNAPKYRQHMNVREQATTRSMIMASNNGNVGFVGRVIESELCEACAAMQTEVEARKLWDDASGALFAADAIASAEIDSVVEWSNVAKVERDSHNEQVASDDWDEFCNRFRVTTNNANR